MTEKEVKEVSFAMSLLSVIIMSLFVLAGMILACLLTENKFLWTQ